MFHLNRRKNLQASVDFRKPHSTYGCQANKAGLNQGNRQKRVMVLVKATEASENENASAEWTGRWDSGDDR
jgi:hypothetical protein